MDYLAERAITIKKPPIIWGFVNWLGLEPRTHTLKVYCSTN